MLGKNLLQQTSRLQERHTLSKLLHLEKGSKRGGKACTPHSLTPSQFSAQILQDFVCNSIRVIDYTVLAT